jgi:hypothetical protein
VTVVRRALGSTWCMSLLGPSINCVPLWHDAREHYAEARCFCRCSCLLLLPLRCWCCCRASLLTSPRMQTHLRLLLRPG